MIEVADISYQAGGAGTFMAMPAYTAVYFVAVGIFDFCAFGVDSGSCVETDPDTTDAYDGIDFNDVYRIRAAAITDAAGNPNARFEWIPRPPTVPGAPENLQVVAGDTQVALTWDASASNGSPIIRYEYQVGADGLWESISPDVTALMHTVTNLNNDQEYMLRVRAVNAEGEGAPSSSVSVTPVSPNLSGLDGAEGVTLADARIFYYAHTLSAVLSNSADRGAVLDSLLAPGRDADQALADAGNLSFDLNGDGKTDTKDAAVLYYSFTLEGALGDGSPGSGIPAIRDAILTPLLEGTQTVEGMLEAAHDLRTQ